MQLYQPRDPATATPAVVTRRRASAPLPIRLAVFTAAYLSWRPSVDIMFTVSDALFITGFIYLLIVRRVPNAPFASLTPLLVIGYAVMMTGLFISSIFDADPMRFVIVSIQYGFAWLVLPFVLCGHGRDYTMSLAKYFLASVALMEAFGAVIYFTFYRSFHETRSILGLDFLSGSRRLGAFVTDANWNGAVAAMAVPFAVYLVSARQIRPITGAVAIALLLLGVVLSASFTAFCSVAAALLVFVAAGVIRPPLWTIPIIVAISLGVAHYGLPTQFEKRVGTAVATGEISQAGTFEGRLALVKNTWKLLGKHYILGVGADQDRVVNGLRAPVHNMYLLIWIEGGLLALLGWLLIICTFIARAISAYRFDRRAASLALSVVAIFITFSIASPHMYARLWAVPVLLALAIAQSAILDALRPRPARRFLRNGLLERLPWRTDVS
jgi:O-antigen ligase